MSINRGKKAIWYPPQPSTAVELKEPQPLVLKPVPFGDSSMVPGREGGHRKQKILPKKMQGG